MHDLILKAQYKRFLHITQFL